MARNFECFNKISRISKNISRILLFSQFLFIAKLKNVFCISMNILVFPCIFLYFLIIFGHFLIYAAILMTNEIFLRSNIKVLVQIVWNSIICQFIIIHITIPFVF